MKRAEKGSVLLQVLVVGMIVAFIAAGMAEIILTRYYSNNRAANGSQATRTNGGSWNQLLGGWTTAWWSSGHTVCSDQDGFTNCSWEYSTFTNYSTHPPNCHSGSYSFSNPDNICSCSAGAMTLTAYALSYNTSYGCAASYQVVISSPLL